MARADSQHTTNPSTRRAAGGRLSTLFTDPFLRAAFERAERDSGGGFATAEPGRPRRLRGGATAALEMERGQ